MIASVSKEQTTYAQLPDRFEAGTPPIAEALGLARACQYLNELGIKTVQEHEQELTGYALERLSSIEGLTWYGPEDITRRVGVIPFTLKGIHHHDVGQLLADQGICVRAGHHCAMPFHAYLGLSGTTRASFSIYNTKEDVDRLIEGLHYVKKKFL
jgi:cysteine desulfurase/selenocysteine lyase